MDTTEFQNLLHHLHFWGVHQWHVGYLSRRTHDEPPGDRGRLFGQAQLEAETTDQNIRLAWAEPLAKILTDNGHGHELFGAINFWGHELWQLGWNEAAPDGRLVFDPLEEHAAETTTAKQAWLEPLRTLVTVESEAGA